MKPGWRTSEAHITVITIAGSFLLSRVGLSDDCRDEILTKVGPYVAAGVASLGYAVSRGIAKLRAPAQEPAPPSQ